MSEILLGFVGDVVVNRDFPREAFNEVEDILKAPALMFANLECAYTDDPKPLPDAPSVISSPARNLEAYKGTGFNIASLANNHILDVGHEAMLETRAYLRALGIQTCGVGASLSEAREPALIESCGVRIAVLAYASVFPKGHDASASRPGLAPMRAYNVWREPYQAYHAPGVLPMVTTIPDQADLARLTEDIQRAKEQADVVITSFHWGDQTCAFHLTDHETRIARYCIDQGAHMVVGHHHHAIRGMEWYKGKPIVYGLGHFVFDLRWEWSEEAARKFRDSEIGRHYSRIRYAAGPRQGWPLLPFPEDARMTMMAWAKAGKDGITDIGFLPCWLPSDGVVRPLRLDSEECSALARYFEKCNETQGLRTMVVTDGAVRIAGYDTFRVVPG